MIDLHSHSTCSDGSEAPERVAELAAEAGLRALALTDHDNVAGLSAARRRAESLGIGFVAGCEVSCAFSPGSMHVLCYYVDESNDGLGAELARLRDDRADRNGRLLDRLAELGISLDAEEVAAEAGSEVIGRPHVAAVLVRHGHAESINDAFDRLLAKGAPAYVDRADADVDTVLRLTAAAGGVAVLAHPFSLGLGDNELEEEVSRLATAGLAGLECIYGRYRPDEREALVALARRHELVPTGGSDFHGSYKPDLQLGTGTGDLAVPDDVLEELSARRP